MQTSNSVTEHFDFRALGRRASRSYGTDTDLWSDLAETAILVLGSPRSGTTWLAKIFDSHPDSLYRHEPDEIAAAPAGTPPTAQLAAWIGQRGLRSAAKRPFFRKSWRPGGAETIWRACAAALAAAARWDATAAAARRIDLPDMIARRHRDRARAVIKLVAWDGSAAARTMPGIRCVFILRHPCGQVASIIEGLRKKSLSPTADEPSVSVGGRAWAARHGIDPAAFDALPDASRYAWAWRSFNEPAVDSLAGLPNAKILIYEDLCRDPLAETRKLFSFAGLSWDAQTTAFLEESTRHERPSGYFDVFRTTELVAERWRQSMSPQDQESVLSVVRSSRLARCWAGLAET